MAETGLAGSEEAAYLQRVAARGGVLQHTLSDGRLKEFSERIRLFDIDGIADVAGVDRSSAVRIAKAHSELVAGSPERRVLRSPDARKLAKEILTMFSNKASSPLGKNAMLFLSPSIERHLIQERLSRFESASNVLGSLTDEKLEQLVSLLSGLSFDRSGSKKQAEPEMIAHYRSRQSLIDTTRAVVEGFPELSAFFQGVRPEVLRTAQEALKDYSSSELLDADAILADAELLINERFRKERPDPDRARTTVEEQVENISNALGFNANEDSELRRAALERLSIPFEFDRTLVRKVVSEWRTRKEEERAKRLSAVESRLAKIRGEVELAISAAVYLDTMLAVVASSRQYGLKPPSLGTDGISFLKGRNLFLLSAPEESGGQPVEPVDYVIGKTGLKIKAKPRNVVMLTGANSGGKTTLVTTVASVHIMTLLGLPVPCESAEIAPMPIYLFRRRVTRKIGSLEQALSSLIPVFGERHRKLVLMDEFEALTEPGAAGRILAGIVNSVATTSSLLLLVTHLARETLPHVKLPIRVDGIEAEGLDEKGELLVKRQPLFDHIGSSTPKLIIMKLSKTSNKRNRELYDGILASLQDEAAPPIQTPIGLPWLQGERTRTKNDRK